MRIPTLTAAVCLLLGRASGQEVTAALREGVYSDTDQTEVIRSLAAVDAAWSGWHLFARESVDIVTSASLDVRTSPALDAMSSASSVSMSDRRFETTAGGAYDDGRGHSLSLSGVYATERDYTSAGGSVAGSYDLAGRRLTLLGGVNADHSDAGSILDPTFDRTLDEVGFSGGLALVVARGDALRLRYDGSYLTGYQASPYRNVRFGDYTVQHERRSEVLMFSGTIGPTTGLPETVPGTRMRHAVVAEWLHSLAPDIGLGAELRLARDSWGIRSATAGADVRYAAEDWRLRAGYRFYLQSAADFFLDKYTLAPDAYTYYTSDKELGDERGHIVTLDVGYLLKDWPTAGHSSQIDLLFDVLHYDYPGFTLLETRTSMFAQLGLRLDF